MKILNQFAYYKNNIKYANYLDRGRPEWFKLYIDEILRLSRPKEKILDVGCGTGIVVDQLAHSNRIAYGVEIAKPSIQLARKKRDGNYYLYDGNKLPFQKNTFAVVGSFTVLEHVDNMEQFLLENVRVLRPGGHLLICCPNFLSLTSSYHYRTHGWSRKLLNLVITFVKLLKLILINEINFDHFAPIARTPFQPDDDAINLTNPIDLMGWAKIHGLHIVAYQGSLATSGLSLLLGQIPILNLFTGGVFLTLRK